MKKMSLVLALIMVFLLTACSRSTVTAPFQIESWGEAEGWNGKILGVWYNIQKDAGDETVFGFSADGSLIYAASVDAKEADTVYYDVDETEKMVSFYENSNGEKGKLLGTARIVDNGGVLCLVGEDIALAREVDLDAARAVYPELVAPEE